MNDNIIIESIRDYQNIVMTLSIPGICDYLNVADVINLCKVQKNHFHLCKKLKRKFIKNKVKKVLIKCYLFEKLNTLKCGSEVIDVNCDDLRIFLHNYREYIESIRILICVDGNTQQYINIYPDGQQDQKYQELTQFYKIIQQNCLNYTDILRVQDKCTEYDKRVLKLILIDGVLKYLNTTDCLNIFHSFHETLSIRGDLTLSFFQIHVPNYRKIFKYLKIFYSSGRFTVLTIIGILFSTNYIHEIFNFFKHLQHEIKMVKLNFMQRREYENVLTFFIQILKKWKNLESITLGVPKNMIDSIRLWTNEIENFKINVTEYFMQIESLEELKNLTSLSLFQKAEITKLSLESFEFNNMDSNDFEQILTLENIESLSLSTYYNNLSIISSNLGTTLWSFLSKIKLVNKAKVFPKLYNLLIHNQEEYINDFLKGFKNLCENYNSSTTIENIFIYNATIDQEVLSNILYFSPKTLYFSECKFENNTHYQHKISLTNLNTLKTIIFSNTHISSESKLFNANIHHLRFGNCKSLTNPILFKIFEKCSSLKVIGCFIIQFVFNLIYNNLYILI